MIIIISSVARDGFSFSLCKLATKQPSASPVRDLITSVERLKTLSHPSPRGAMFQEVLFDMKQRPD